MSIKSELLRIQQADPDNVLRPVEVVEWAAENKDSDLYRALEWDDPTAAHQHRLWQVRQLIMIHVTTEDRTPLLVSLSIDRRNEGGGYRAISDVADHPDLREIMLADALAELERVQTKYARVQELAEVWREADKVQATRPRRTRRASVRDTVSA